MKELKRRLESMTREKDVLLVKEKRRTGRREATAIGGDGHDIEMGSNFNQDIGWKDTVR